MERGERITTLMATANKIFTKAKRPNPPTPPPSPPPPVPAELEINMQPQPVGRQGGGHGGCTPLRANPPTVEQQSSWMAAPTMYAGPVPQGGIMQPVHLHGQGGADSQGQYDSVPPMRLSNGQSLRCVGVLNGEYLYEVPSGHVALPVVAGLPLNTSNSKFSPDSFGQNRKREPYLKKPPNAFLLFMKEHRANVEAEFQGSGSVAINTILGELWKSLTKEEQAKYYKQAETERVLHAQRHPEWSASDNYGKKSKRKRSKASQSTSQSSSQPPVTRPHDVSTVLATEAPHTPTVQVTADCTDCAYVCASPATAV